MSGSDAAALLPLILLGATPVATMLAIAVRRSPASALGVTLAGLAASFAALFPAARAAPRQVTPLLAVDRYALFYAGLVVATTAAVAVLAHGYVARRAVRREEVHVLLGLGATGAAVLAAASHFASFLLGLEILSVSLYGLVGYASDRPRSLEAAVKYLVLAASSAAFLLFGMALVYGALGTMSFAGIAAAVGAGRAVDGALLVAGVALLVTGVGFKLALVPFHLWTPDVYEGAPAPVAPHDEERLGVFEALALDRRGEDFSLFRSGFVPRLRVTPSLDYRPAEPEESECRTRGGTPTPGLTPITKGSAEDAAKGNPALVARIRANRKRAKADERAFLRRAKEAGL